MTDNAIDQLLLTSDTNTGRLNPSQVPGFGPALDALVDIGMVHPSYVTPEDAHLTLDGLAARAQLAMNRRHREAGGGQPEHKVLNGFAHDDGRRTLAPAVKGREQTVGEAWERVMGQRHRWKGSTARLTEWERQHPLWSASLTLEAEGHTPCAIDEYGRYARPGYIVDPAGAPEAARIKLGVPYTWSEIGHPQRKEASYVAEFQKTSLEGYASTLEKEGWHVAPRREGTPMAYLLAVPAE